MAYFLFLLLLYDLTSEALQETEGTKKNLKNVVSSIFMKFSSRNNLRTPPQDFSRSENGGDSAGAQITTPDFQIFLHPCDSSISVRVKMTHYLLSHFCVRSLTRHKWNNLPKQHRFKKMFCKICQSE